jgi:hypothetical protein
LSVAFTLHLIESGGDRDVSKTHLVPFETLRGREEQVLAMGELDARQMADHPKPIMLEPATLADYRAAWAAMTSSEPRGLEEFASARPNAHPWLKRAMRLMLRRFPDKQTGLAHWDRVLLEMAREHPGRSAIRVVAAAMVKDERQGDFVGDYFLFGRMLKMGDATLPRPLLELRGDRTNMRECEVALTDFGRAVLDGRASNYPTNPIEDWAAGVKLSSAAGNLWFNDGGRLARA